MESTTVYTRRGIESFRAVESFKENIPLRTSWSFEDYLQIHDKIFDALLELDPINGYKPNYVNYFRGISPCLVWKFGDIVASRDIKTFFRNPLSQYGTDPTKSIKISTKESLLYDRGVRVAAPEIHIDWTTFDYMCRIMQILHTYKDEIESVGISIDPSSHIFIIPYDVRVGKTTEGVYQWLSLKMLEIGVRVL